jgi:hypothetical protein
MAAAPLSFPAMRRAIVLLWLASLCLSCRSKESRPDSDPAAAADEDTAPAEIPAAQDDPTYGSARFRISGHWEAAGNAGAVVRGAGRTVHRIELATPPSYRRQHKRTFIIQLAFTEDFEPERGTYPIAPDHRSLADTAGATLVVHTDTVDTFAAEPRGEITFTEVGEKVRGRFRFEVRNVTQKSAGTPRVAVVAGEFDGLREPPSAPR